MQTDNQKDQAAYEELIRDIVTTCSNRPTLSQQHVLNALLVVGANIVANVNEKDHRDYIAPRAFRKIIETVRTQQKAAKEAATQPQQ